MTTLILTFFSLSLAWAQPWYEKLNDQESTPQYQQCERGTETGKEQLEVAKSCINYALMHAPTRQKHLSENKKFFTVGFGNMLFVRELVDENKQIIKDHVIAGDYSLLSNIHSVLISAEHKEIFVLNQSDKPKLLVFDIRRDGNVAPSRVLEPDWMKDVTQISLHRDNKKITCYSASHNTYYILNNSGDSRSPASAHKLSYSESKTKPADR